MSLVLHDECHNTSSDQCHDFLKFCKLKKIPTVGFSATPLRTGKNDKPLLLEIYGKDDKTLNLLTDYNMIYAINNGLILPPEFYWYKLEIKDTQTKKNYKNEIVSEEELGSVLGLLNNIIPNMSNKKIIAWCRTIQLAKTWKKKFEKNHRQRPNMAKFTFGLDTSDIKSTDYDTFKNSKGSSILFCANKHREGSDIKYLDACIFLDKVKKRGSIPFIQSIGRVLRTCPNTVGKTKGIIIDGFIKNDDYEREFISKIISYYSALQNLTDIVNDTQKETKLDTYMDLIDLVEFDKEHNIIDMVLGKTRIKINCSKLQWDDITTEFDKVLKQKIKITEEEVEKVKFIKLKKRVRCKKIKNKTKYKNYAEKYNLVKNPEIVYRNHGWINYYDFLNIDTSSYPENKNEFIDKCNKYGICDINMYHKYCDSYKLPCMPDELYPSLSFVEIEPKKDDVDKETNNVDVF